MQRLQNSLQTFAVKQMQQLLGCPGGALASLFPLLNGMNAGIENRRQNRLTDIKTGTQSANRLRCVFGHAAFKTHRVKVTHGRLIHTAESVQIRNGFMHGRHCFTFGLHLHPGPHFLARREKGRVLYKLMAINHST